MKIKDSLNVVFDKVKNILNQIRLEEIFNVQIHQDLVLIRDILKSENKLQSPEVHRPFCCYSQ